MTTKKQDYTVEFKNDGIQFNNYYFKPASIYPSAFIPYINICEITYWLADVSIRLSNKEHIFFPRKEARECLNTLKRLGFEWVYRHDPWSGILEPYLDTEFSEDHKERIYIGLEKMGISRISCDELRSIVGPTVEAYNALAMNWMFFTICDLLVAYDFYNRFENKRFTGLSEDSMYWITRAKEFFKAKPVNDNVEHDVYRLAMDVADKAGQISEINKSWFINQIELRVCCTDYLKGWNDTVIIPATTNEMTPDCDFSRLLYDKAGSELLRELVRMGPISPNKPVITKGYHLSNQIIHCLGPNSVTKDEHGVLVSCFTEALSAINDPNRKTVDIPAEISGTVIYPIDYVAESVFGAVKNGNYNYIETVRIIVSDRDTMKTVSNLIESLI